MKNSGFLGSLVLTLLLVFCLLLIARESFAAVDTETLPQDGKVEIIYPAEALAPYRERRGNWSTVFGFNVDMIYPDQFRSRVKTVSRNGSVEDASYEDLFGTSPVTMMQGQFGLKYNFGLGSLGLGIVAGMGEISDGRTASRDREIHELTLLKKGVTATFTMDNLFPEPYIAPYAEVQAFTLDYTELRYAPGDSSNAAENSGGTAMTTGIVLGGLIQLNSLDPDSSLTAQSSSGFENIFLDLFVSQYNTSDLATDPNFATSTNFGGGLKIEF